MAGSYSSHGDTGLTFKRVIQAMRPTAPWRTGPASLGGLTQAKRGVVQKQLSSSLLWPWDGLRNLPSFPVGDVVHFQFTFLSVPLFKKLLIRNALPLGQPSWNLLPSLVCLPCTSSWLFFFGLRQASVIYSVPSLPCSLHCWRTRFQLTFLFCSIG